MKNTSKKPKFGSRRSQNAKILCSVFLLFVLLAQALSPALACGPAYTTPIFDYKRAPEDPFLNFAAGKIGIVKPTYRRIVLFAAYRYLNGGAFNADEQQALVDVWNAEFNNREYLDNDVSEAVKKWVETRKSVAKDEENLPPIYTEREYGGYDFFPNCTKSAFETAAKTLNDRAASYGAENKYVQNWLEAQDKVFTNCSSGQSIPEPAPPDAPEWLKKDREYQIAAAHFYSLNYEAAREIWTRIANDTESVWSETADYLIARTLVREASLIKDQQKAKAVYEQAETHLNSLVARGGEYQNASIKLLNLVKYRTKPEERVQELAQMLSMQMPNENFRQDLIDFNWLMDKFTAQTLAAEETRKEELRKQEEAQNPRVSPTPGIPDSNVIFNNESESVYEKINRGEMLGVYLKVAENDLRNFYFPVSKTDEEIFSELEISIGRNLNENEKEAVREARRQSYRNKTSNVPVTEYQGGYFGSEELRLELVPDFLRRNDLTDWLFTYQLQDANAFNYALERWRESRTDLWLMTVLTKAKGSSQVAKELLEEAEKIDRNAPAFPTIAYNAARIYVEQGKRTEARKLIDEVLNSTLDLPVSTRNLFLAMRMPLAETLDEFLKYAQRKPFGFDFGGVSGTIEEIVARQKSWYDPKFYENQTREEYEREVEELFREEMLWQDRLMFDEDSVEVINRYFPTEVLLEAQKSPELPEYLKKRLTLAIWVRAVLLGDETTAMKTAPEVVRHMPELGELFRLYQTAGTPVERRRAALFIIIKNPVFTPYIESGIGKSDNVFEEFDIDDWWCQPFDREYDDETDEMRPKKLPPLPAFLTQAQAERAQEERNRLVEIGDAPKFFGETLLEWTRLAPNDRRLPEILYIAYRANGWTKYGCGNNIELQQQIGKEMRRRFPKSEWTRRLDEKEEQ